MPMDYFGRLGLVFRKNRERTSSCQVVAESKETRCAGDTGHLKSAINETGHTQGLVEFRSTSSPKVLLAHYFPRHDMLVDLEYLEYEKQVQARARALKSSGVSSQFKWKSLVFWKRRRHRHHQVGITPFMTSGASTPLPQSYSATPRRRRGSCATVGPLYTNESPTSQQQLSRRVWKDDCNMSPYVALSDRRQRGPMMSPGPLYRV